MDKYSEQKLNSSIFKKKLALGLEPRYKAKNSAIQWDSLAPRLTEENRRIKNNNNDDVLQTEESTSNKRVENEIVWTAKLVFSRV